MEFVTCDLGASSTRYSNSSGKLMIIPNNMIFIENKNIVTGEVLPDIEPVNMLIDSENNIDKLEFIFEKTGGTDVEGKNTHFPMHVILGNMAYRKNPKNDRPGPSNKTSQRVYLASILASIAMSRLNNEVGEDVTFYMSLPPTELKVVHDKLNELYCGTYNVFMPKIGENGTHLSFNIVNVRGFEESTCAITSFFFTTKCEPKPAFKEHGSSSILSIDIGASTTDFAVYKNGAPVDKLSRTEALGGNVVRDNIYEYIRGEFGEMLSFDDLDSVVSSGVFHKGIKPYVLSEAMENSKRDLAERIVEHIKYYFNSTGFSASSIKLVLVSGGGSMNSQYANEDGQMVVTSRPVSDFLTAEMKRVFDTDFEVVNHNEIPRLANVYGLFIRARFDEAREKKEQAAKNGIDSNTID